MTDTYETVGAIRRAQTTCPRCDIPIPDTAYVCTRCADILAVALRNAAANWSEVEAAVARQTAMAGNGSVAQTPRTLHGPTDIPCHHGSCLAVRKSQLRATWSEEPISGEKNLVSFGSLEDAWIITNTATTWARVVNEETHRPIPTYTPSVANRADRAAPARLTVARQPERKHQRNTEPLCRWSDIPISVCACGHPTHEETP